MMDIFLLLAGGLSLFVFGIVRLSYTLKDNFFDRAKLYTKKFTSNILTGIITGIIITMLLGSSSAVIILTIILVNAGALNFRNSMGIVLGSNIGTTFSSQIIALSISEYSPMALVAGIITSIIFRNSKIKKIGTALLYLGLIFFGLYIIEISLQPLQHMTEIMEKLKKLEDPLNGAITGIIMTTIIQSSSAVVGIIITLAKQGFINLSGGVAVMLGANLGTCTDTLVAMVWGDRQAIRTGIFHLFFNLASVILGLLVFSQFLQLIEWLSPASDTASQIANAHFIFNFIGVILFLPFISISERFINTIIPDKIPRYP